jgi:acetylornithine deacetylase/succinyl-diaminopimelate desuccinylase-like protein
VIFGPGKPRMCHQVDEYIEIGDLDVGVRLFKNVLGKFLI